MIVRLTHDQYRVVMNRVSTLHREAMEQHQSKVGVKQRDFDLPAIAWRQILDHLTATSYGPVGGKMPDVSPSVYTAVKRIASRVMEIEAHPAFRQARVEGYQGDVLIGWYDRRLNETHPYPFPDGEPIWFTPSHFPMHGLKVTDWLALFERPKQIQSWTMDPDTHLEFLGRSAKPEHLADS